MTSLSIAKFRPKVNKKFLGIWFDLVLKVKYSKILTFRFIFLGQKSTKFLWFYLLKNTKMVDYLLLSKYFDNCNFWYTLFSKNAPKSLEHFHGHFHRSCLFTIKLSYTQLFKWSHSNVESNPVLKDYSSMKLRQIEKGNSRHFWMKISIKTPCCTKYSN